MIISVGDGEITAEAGASFVMMEKAARAKGQELSILPSTVGSTIGGFIAGGSGGTGSIANGAIWDGYLHSLLVVPCTDDATPVQVPYPENTAMAHAFGVSGVIAEATVELRPAQDLDRARSRRSPTWRPRSRPGRSCSTWTPRRGCCRSTRPGSWRPTARSIRPCPPTGPASAASSPSRACPAATAIVERNGGRVDAVRPRGRR